MTRTTLSASIALAAVVLTASACIIRNKATTDAPLNRPGYGPIPFIVQHKQTGITLEQEISNVRNRQDQLRAAAQEYEQAYQQATTAMTQETQRAKNAEMQQAFRNLLQSLGREHAVALQRARTTQERISTALNNAADALRAKDTLLLATATERRRERLAMLTRQASNAAGFLDDQTRRVQQAVRNTGQRPAL
jgi:hypothetical protein